MNNKIKQQEIEKMAHTMSDGCGDDCVNCIYNEDCPEYEFARRLFNAGYRNADEVKMKESAKTAKEILETLGNIWDENGRQFKTRLWYKRLREQYGIEVDD